MKHRRTLAAAVVMAAIAYSAAIAASTRPAAATVISRIVTTSQSGTIVATKAQPQSWPQFAFNAGHDGRNPAEKILNAGNVGTLQQAWSFSTGATNAAGNAVESGGIVYVPSTNGTLFALDASTGKQRWSYATGSGFSTNGSAPAVDAGLVFTVCNVASGVQGICALNAKTGALKWSWSTAGATTFAETPPVLDGGYLYVGACGNACGYWGLLEKPGRPTYFAAEPGGCSLNNGAVPAIFSGTFVASIGCTDATMFGAAENILETPKWQTGVSGNVAAVSATGDFNAFVTTYAPGGQAFYSLDLESGSIQWQTTTTKSTEFAGPAASGGSSLFVPIGNEVFSYAPEGKNGQPKLHGSCTSCNTPMVAYANGILYILNAGVPQALDAKSFAVLWTAPTIASASAPIIVNGVVYAGCNGSSFCAWTLPSMIRRQ